MIYFLIVFIGLLVLIFLLAIFCKPFNQAIEKKTFSKRVYKKVYKIAKYYDFYLLNEVALNVGNKTIHFDHILFGDKYIFCIGKKFYSNGLNGNVRDEELFHLLKKDKTELVKNPLILHNERVRYFQSLLTTSKDLFVSMVVINNSCKLDEKLTKDHESLLVNLKNLEKLVKRYEKDESVSIIDPVKLKKLVKDIYEIGVKN